MHEQTMVYDDCIQYEENPIRRNAWGHNDWRTDWLSDRLYSLFPLMTFHIVVMGPMITGDGKFHDRSQFTVPCDCKFRYMIHYNSTMTYWPGKPWLRITRIVYESQRFIGVNRHHLSSIIVIRSHPQRFLVKSASFMVNRDRESWFVPIHGQL